MLMAVQAALLMSALMAQDPQIPAPRGYVNDFAGVVGADRAARIERIINDVHAKSGGEIAVVTLADLAGRDVGEVALQIGRQWKVGAAAEVGDQRRNAGVVILVVPKETSSDGRGHISIQTGNGVEGFITDARAGDIRRDALPFLRQADYGAALEMITLRVAESYAREFGFALDTSLAAPRALQPRRTQGFPPGLFVLGFIILFLLLGGRRGGNGLFWFLLGQALSNGRHRGGGFGGGGFGGGGFGGFGGGGGFSGGGSSGSW